MLHPQELVDLVAHVDRNPDCAALIGNGTGNGLTDPPGGVSTEFMAAAVIKLLRSSDEPNIAFLDQIKERNAATHVFLGNRDHQAGVGSDEVFTGGPTVFNKMA